MSPRIMYTAQRTVPVRVHLEKRPAAVYGYLECTSPINRNAVDVLIGPSYSGPDVLSTRHASVWQRRG